jgi:hypothetical protein
VTASEKMTWWPAGSTWQRAQVSAEGADQEHLPDTEREDAQHEAYQLELKEVRWWPNLLGSAVAFASSLPNNQLWTWFMMTILVVY